MVVRHTSHARYDLWYHYAWATKYRRKVWKDRDVRESVKRLLRKIASEYDMRIDTIEVVSDHVHFTLTAPPRIAPAQIAQIIKSISTRALLAHYPWLKKYYWGGEIWAGGYFVRSVGPGLTKEQIDAYILAQSEEN